MSGRELLLSVAGDARVVRLPGRDELERLRTIYGLIGCRYAEEVPLAADVTMWLDEEATLGPGPAEPSPPVMLVGAALGHSGRYVGPAVFTGGSDRRGDTRGLSDARLATLSDLLDRFGVRVVRAPAGADGDG
ncbi:MAG TPA: hypothetical protein VIJ00_06775 [Nakamurella sp.]